MSVLRDFMDRLTPAAQTNRSRAYARPCRAGTTITSISPTIIILVFGFQQAHSGATGHPTLLFVRPAFRVGRGRQGKGGRSRKPDRETALNGTSRWTAKDGAKFSRALTKSAAH